MASTASPALPGVLALAPGVELGCDVLESSGVALAVAPDGTLALTAGRVVARGVRLRSARVTVDVAGVTLDGVSARLAPAAAAPTLQSLAVEEMAIEDLHAGLAWSPPRDAGAALALDALAELEGLVRAYVTDALWIVDAEVVVPIAGGAIDFNAVEIEHVGPNSTLGISASGIHVQAPGQVRMDVVTFTAPPPGASFAAPSRFPFGAGDRGRLDLVPFLRALLEAPPDAPLARPTDAGIAGALRRTRVAGELHLGDGTLAHGAQRVELAGRAGGTNRVTLDSTSLAERIVICVPQLLASAATLTAAGRDLRASSLSAAVEAHVLGAAARADGPGVLLSVARAALRDVVVGPAA
jgi:hypothetical protein